MEKLHSAGPRHSNALRALRYCRNRNKNSAPASWPARLAYAIERESCEARKLGGLTPARGACDISILRTRR